jgi:hypothetical protein
LQKVCGLQRLSVDRPIRSRRCKARKGVRQLACPALCRPCTPAAAAAAATVVRSDLRPEVAYMGEKFMLTPNLDKFAAESLVFNRAFCQQAVR